MTSEMLNMSKEEIIQAIVNLDKHGKELDKLQTETIEIRGKLLDEIRNLFEQIDQLNSGIEHGQHIMQISAMAKAELTKLLQDKYGCFIM